MDVLEAFQQFWGAISQMGKVSLRGFKQFLYNENYPPNEISSALNRIMVILNIPAIPNIRESILQQMFETSIEEIPIDQRTLIMEDILIRAGPLLQVQ